MGVCTYQQLKGGYGHIILYIHVHPPLQTMIHQLITLKECQSQCIHKMGELRFDKEEDFLGSYFHYLQHGYHMCTSIVDTVCAQGMQRIIL